MREQSTSGTDRIKNRRWIARKLRACRFVSWDRFTVHEWDGEQSVSVYGWIEREDEHEDFAMVIFWPESESLYNLTSSVRYSQKFTEALHGESDGHSECRRVEDTFNVENAVMTDGGASSHGTERPEGWPEHYHGTPTPQCDHHMMWDTGEGCYVCIYECGKTAEEPPKSKVQAGKERDSDE
jgi:hypothetical protein